MSADKKTKIIAISLLLLTILVCIPTLHYRTFGDEFDTLAAAKKMTQGQVLYRDVFSHHFPLSYCLTALAFKIFGASVTVARMSLVVLQVLVFLTIMLLTKRWIELGLVSLIWSVLRVFYFGNMVIYPSYSAVFILGFGALGLFALGQEKDYPWYYWLVMSLFAILAFLTDPLSVYPAVVIGIALLIKNYRYGLRFGLFFAGFLVLCFLGLFLSGIFSDFYESAIHFNTAYYGKHSWTEPIRIRALLYNIRTLFDLFQPQWFAFNPMRPIPADVTVVDHWAFTGLLYRLSIYFWVTILAIRKKWLAAITVFMFAAAILVMKSRGFYAQVFNLFALYCFVSLISNLIENREERKAIRIPLVIGGVMLALSFIWLFSRGVWTSYIKPENDFKKHWEVFTPQVEMFNKLSCGLENVQLAAYPGETAYYWLTDLEPVRGYLFMWPWVAEYALDDVIEALSSPDLKAIVVSPNAGEIWGNKVEEFLAPLHRFVTQNYVSYNEKIYVSPALKEACPGN